MCTSCATLLLATIGKIRQHLPIDESALDFYELGHQLQQLVSIESRKPDSGSRCIEPVKVHIWAEEPDTTVVVLVGLHALEARKAIVEDAGSGIQADRLIGRDLWACPALLCVPFDQKDVVCEWKLGVSVVQNTKEFV